MTSLVGCSGWSEAQAKYFADFSTIELQSTFYDPPSVTLAARWRALAPPAFHFCLKAWQLITHAASSPTYRKLKGKLSPAELASVGWFRPTEQVDLAWERTAAIARVLQARVVLFQCPASFQPEAENLGHLRRFFTKLKREQFQLAWEPRGDWPPALVSSLCAELDLLSCVDPLATQAAAARQASYWRLHGLGGYGYRYTDVDLEQLAQLEQQHEIGTAANRQRYIFFNNIWMKADALRFQHRLR